MNSPKRYLVTSALPYANGLKHIGHLAGAYLPADIYVRYLRAMKKDVVYVSGSDEHGAAITIQAMKEQTTPREIVDKYHAILKQNMADLGISFDIYHRTSDPIHHETAQEFFTSLNNRGELEVKETEQFFDEEAKTFLADRYIVGTCPVCGHPNAYGDQCEKCGSSLSPEMLINPRSTLSGNAPVMRATKHWFLPLNKHENFLREWILTEHKEDWKTNVLGQCKSWLDAGLQPRAVTRDLDWGVQVPLADAQGKVLYVWFDAPIGYISATKQWALDNKKEWEPYWHDKDTKLVHFIGKDNIVFHCIIFPVMLKLHGNVLPENVPSNEFMNLEGDKMSTSRGWSIEMEDYINDWIRKDNGGDSMADVLRYYLTSISPETKDSEFTWKGFQDANNNELVSIFGNFVNRTFVLMHKLCKGKVPVLHADIMDESDRRLFTEISASKSRVESLLEQYKFRDAQFEVIDLARKGNKYMQDKQPWIVAKQTGENGLPNAEAQQQIDNCLHICLQLTANLSILVNPFLPFTARKLCYMMKVVDKMLDWENAGKSKLLSVGYSLREPQLLFRKIDDTEIAAQIEKLKLKTRAMEEAKQASGETSPSQPEPAIDKPVDVSEKENPVKPEIVFDDFAKVDLRIGTVIKCEKVEKADKLLRLEVDLGFETRTVVSGIAMHFTPEEVLGKQVTVVANLAPRKMRGIESKGMILMAEDKNGKLHFVNPEGKIDEGSGVS
ncbi:methionine--tRNA ligase [Segetibacter sp. 3557_3]|uniref:methionine--tRNA ligase n=1 Tax=Segetibacter sp. 3557_3 TaxID=2547429 RepID=UPI0010588249|nr:methionine--tRNA ligase [Segetibacter sp. 3557_3]TDH23360.1 methionine--tRNA ligase [Segetibacter sp. 3557_3]